MSITALRPKCKGISGKKWCARGDDFRTLLSELVSFVRQDEISAQENLRLGLITFIPATIIPATIRKTYN
jgi:hypothetical protein